MTRSTLETAESRKTLARLRYANAREHAAGVRSRFGFMSPEHLIARHIVEEARRELVASYDAVIAASRGEVSP